MARRTAAQRGSQGDIVLVHLGPLDQRALAALQRLHGSQASIAVLAIAERPQPAPTTAPTPVASATGVEPVAHVQPGPSGPPIPAVVSLTPRQHEIVRELLAGRRNADIALELGISVRTVEYHIALLFTKLGATSRWELADRVRQLGLA